VWLLLLSSLLSLATAQEVQLEQEVFRIARQLRCPVCGSESAADSSAGTSVEFREIIRERLQAGQSEEQIIAYFVGNYGDYILLEPPKRGIHLLVWVLPIVAGAFGVGALVYFLRRWTRSANEPIEVDEEGLERVRRELSRRGNV